ncbi:hypothetical protein Poli38472_008040 [Pythium oligandrum]|uniref:Uncharacterized protein n=1 Tax=Pythium oligandrum TaxID=41045 RepID=A0A8K1FP93_PYTOL|nr:hypothetical protein Poli38472_008040 [Pythium oligandrum]|eukprot:TMW65398.1 hypothetical protein Poli38472_008040 [Pythium oligandrum]
MLKVYNSTITQWDDTDGALTSEAHPLLRSLQFVLTNFTSSKLPMGLWSARFPQGVTVIEFCVTNLVELPPLVSLRWPHQIRLAWEGSPLASVPSVLYELNLTQLSLARNPLTSIPTRVLRVPTLVAFSVAHTAMIAFPSNVTLSPVLEQLSIVKSAVSEMPSWFYDDLMHRPVHYLSEGLTLFAGESPFCESIASQTIENGERIVCASVRDDVSYPLDQEDAQSRV